MIKCFVTGNTIKIMFYFDLTHFALECFFDSKNEVTYTYVSGKMKEKIP